MTTQVVGIKVFGRDYIEIKIKYLLKNKGELC